MTLPTWLSEKLATPPAAGTGIHAWLFSCARQLHAHRSPDEIAQMLTNATAHCGRRVPAREIRDAVQNSAAVAWTRKDERAPRRQTTPPQTATPIGAAAFRWPPVDAVARRSRIRDAAAQGGITGLMDLWERSPVRPAEWIADDWLEWLFPQAEWLCLAADHPATARTRRTERWLFGPAEACGLVVPSPMTAPGGRGLDGRRSHRCLDNTGAREWLVVEFDQGTLAEQAALHWHLREAAVAAGWPRLALCVFSGGKSLHGWYGRVAGAEDAARELMAYAVSLGADPATWNRCQLVRLPGGQRAPKFSSDAAPLPEGWAAPEGPVRQSVFFFDPHPPCPSTLSNSSSSAPFAPRGSTPRPGPMAAASPSAAPAARA